MSKVKKRILALGMAFVMALTMIPMFGSLAFAAEINVADGTTVLDYADTEVNFVDSDGGQFGMFSSGDATTAVIKDDKVVVHYALTTSKKSYQGVHAGPITDIPADGTIDISQYIDIPINDDLTMDFEISTDYCGFMFPIAPIKNEFKASSMTGAAASWTSAKQYYLGIPAEEYLDKEYDLVVSNNVKMFKPTALSVLESEGAYTLNLTLGSTSYSKVFVGYASAATEDAAIDITLDTEAGTGSVDIPVTSVEDPIVLAFYSAKNKVFYNRTLTIDLEAKTAVFDPTTITLEQFNNMTTEEALARASIDTNVDTVNALIEAIQVQTRDANTDKYCTLAKGYYDALSDADKEALDDPGYFGDDTGDASKDDPRNGDEIGEKELLVVSFGTSFNDSRVATINAVEEALEAAYPEYSVRRAFTAQIIINHIQSRDGEVIDNMTQALDRAVANGVKELVVQPTHLMHGAEYDEMMGVLAGYADKIDSITVSEPLLNSDADKTAVAEAAVAAAVETAGYADLDAVAAANTAIVFMGHGTEHAANITYAQMQEVFNGLGYKNVFVGTVEGTPTLEDVVAAVKAAGYTKVILRPLMVVAGDHANNDMASTEDPESWASVFGAELGAANVTSQIKGLGEILKVQQLYVSHVQDVLTGEELKVSNNVKMFKPETLFITEAVGGYVLHLTLGSTSYSKVFVGYASSATEDKAIDITLDTENKKGTVDIPVASVKDPIVLAFYSAKNKDFYNRTLTIDLEAKTAVFDPTVITLEQFDNMTTEEALARAATDTNVDTVNALIEAIQVQTRDKNTDKYCTLAKGYYEPLSDSEKEALDDPDYFGLDTGDASKDDPRNKDEIGEKELLVVSFGTSFNDSRVATINAIEEALEAAYPEYSVRRAFTAQIIINHIQSRDAEVIDNMEQALERAVANGVKELVIQPTHLMHGAEYDEMMGVLAGYKDKFEKLIVSEPLLNSDEDKTIVAQAAVEAAVATAGYADLDAVAAANTAIVFMGHGTEHAANITYAQMQEVFNGLGYKNVFVGTVEGTPTLEDVVAAVKAAGYTKVILRPLMVVAGDHANNDMADTEDPESWASVFGTELGAENVTCQINGLGEILKVQQLYVSHVQDALGPDFPDVNEEDWFYSVVNEIASVKNANGTALMSGYADGTFGPTDPMQRQDFAIMMHRLADEPAVSEAANPFSDADPKGYYYPAILWAKTNNVIAGYDNGEFGVGDQITREQVVTILYRFAKDYKKMDVTAAGDLSKFTDSASVSEWAQDAMTWAVGAGVINGKNEGTLIAPQANAARAEVAAMFMNFMGLVPNTDK